jgi:hypothetical protein
MSQRHSGGKMRRGDMVVEEVAAAKANVFQS